MKKTQTLIVALILAGAVACGQKKTKIGSEAQTPDKFPPQAQTLTPYEAAEVENLNLKLQMLQMLYNTTQAQIEAAHPGFTLAGNQLVPKPQTKK